MSSSKHATKVLNLVTDNIHWSMKKFKKLLMGDLDAKTSAYEIALTVVSDFFWIFVPILMTQMMFLLQSTTFA